MQELYRVIVKPYNYDHWDIFTEDKSLFDQLTKFNDTDEVYNHFGIEGWERIAESGIYPKFPYVLLGESELRQRD